MNAVILTARERPVELSARAPPSLRLHIIHDWDTLLAHIGSDTEPGALILFAEMLSDRGIGVMQALSACGRLPPTAIYLDGRGRIIEQVRPLICNGVELIYEQTALVKHIRNLPNRATVFLADYVCDRLAVRCHLTRRLFRLCARGGPVLTESVQEIADRLGVSRTRLYNALRRAGAPSPEQVQYLFLLFPATRMLQAGERLEDVAATLRFGDPDSLRKSIVRRHGVHLRTLRKSDWRWIADRWISLHCR